ncbi:TIGR02646 family protein [Pseudomonas sp. NFR09]|uniref:retron system putative HNH endonuclease n=1 Tax=Pseudomonas sp. NFR09 TaxID=1566249 RepID=UPI0008BC10ED|nr:retron system putative HNH endonuclease [Pseudomonas sp. NFR09]SET52309.1 TIGR02646 family protein [Pseudomonas sp. NFR09]
MRAIQKRGLGPHQLNNSHANPPITAKAATSRWSGFGYKQQVLTYLLEEQYGLCCYSEIRPDQVGLGLHIEHVENKRQNPQRTFDYNNLAASALDSQTDLHTFNGLASAVFGGHALGKSDAVDVHRFVSCHQPDCSRFFAYLSDGRIVPADGLSLEDEDRASYTIALLNLNSPFLQDLRQQWWDELEALFDDHIEQDMSLHCLAGIDLIPREKRLSPFFSITRIFFGQIAEEVLDQNAPNLK